MADIEKLRLMAYKIAQECKTLQNTEKPWTDEQWRKLSEAIAKLEEKTQGPSNGH